MADWFYLALPTFLAVLIFIVGLILIFNSPSSGIICPSGTCALNPLTGLKDCSARIVANGAVCVPANKCGTPLLYAVNSDGSSNVSGECESDQPCPCSNKLTCPYYVTSYFTSNNTINSNSLSNQRVGFPQKSSYQNNQGQTSSLPPLVMENPSSNFCSINSTWLSRSTPGCYNLSSIPTPEEITTCMGNTTTPPCLAGVLAAIVPNKDQINTGNVNDFLYSCVAGTPCQNQTFSIYDTLEKKQYCITLPG